MQPLCLCASVVKNIAKKSSPQRHRDTEAHADSLRRIAHATQVALTFHVASTTVRCTRLQHSNQIEFVVRDSPLINVATAIC